MALFRDELTPCGSVLAILNSPRLSPAIKDRFGFGYSSFVGPTGDAIDVSAAPTRAAFMTGSDLAIVSVPGGAFNLTYEQWSSRYQAMSPGPGYPHYDAKFERDSDGTYRCEVIRHVRGGA